MCMDGTRQHAMAVVMLQMRVGVPLIPMTRHSWCVYVVPARPCLSIRAATLLSSIFSDTVFILCGGLLSHAAPPILGCSRFPACNYRRLLACTFEWSTRCRHKGARTCSAHRMGFVYAKSLPTSYEFGVQAYTSRGRHIVSSRG